MHVIFLSKRPVCLKKNSEIIQNLVFTASDGPRVDLGTAPTIYMANGGLELNWTSNNLSNRNETNGRTIDANRNKVEGKMSHS